MAAKFKMAAIMSKIANVTVLYYNNDLFPMVWSSRSKNNVNTSLAINYLNSKWPPNSKMAAKIIRN